MEFMKFGIALMLIICLIGTGSVADTQSTSDKSLIHVSGSGTIKTTPDRCEISFSVNTKNSDVKAAQKENARKMDLVMNVLKDPSKGNLGPGEIGTSSYSISEVYNPDEALKTKFGDGVVIYEVSNTITVETSDMDRVGDLIDLAVTNGANGVNSLQFTLSKAKTAEFRNQALQIAVEKAKSDADVVATAMGLTLGTAHEITVEDSYNPPVYYNQDFRSASLAAGPSTPIQPGSIDVSARVSVAYQIA